MASGSVDPANPATFSGRDYSLTRGSCPKNSSRRGNITRNRIPMQLVVSRAFSSGVSTRIRWSPF